MLRWRHLTSYGQSTTLGLMLWISLTYLQDPGIFFSRHHQHYVSSHQNHPDTFGALQVGVHPRDWLHPHAYPGWCAVIAPAKRLRGEALQDQHEARAFRACQSLIPQHDFPQHISTALVSGSSGPSRRDLDARFTNYEIR